MDKDNRDELGLLKWQWANYPASHRNRLNLALHALTAPLFLLGIVAVLIAPFISWQLAPAGILGVLAAFVAQGRGHKQEQVPSRPFRSPFDILVRIFAEQWVTFPRYILSGGFARAWRSA